MATILTGRKADKDVLIVSIVVFIYFYTMLFISSYRNNYILIGVLIEILTLPILTALIVSIVLSVIQLIKEKLSSRRPVYSLILLLAVIVRFLI